MSGIEPFCLAVDVGNSAIKIGWPGSPIARFSLKDAAWPGRIQCFIERLDVNDDASDVPANGLRKPHCWVVASVNGPAARRLRKVVEGFADSCWRELTRAEVGVPLDIRNPDTIGIDRLLGALGAMAATGRASVISVDAGSAVTVDLIHEGRFRGGAILPGIGLQFKVLTQATDCLPAVVEGDSKAIEIPGRDTVAAIRCGVLLGVAGAIDRLIESYRTPQADMPIVMTGGDSETLMPLLKHPVLHRPALIHDAITTIANKPSWSVTP